jgi:hypothetical protein
LGVEKVSRVNAARFAALDIKLVIAPFETELRRDELERELRQAINPPKK